MIKRILAILLGVIIGAGAICGVWYRAAPREFLQTVLSDEAYLAVTLTQNAGRMTKNVAKASKTNKAFAFSGTMDANMDKTALLGSEKAASAVSDYMSTMNLSGKVFFDKGSFKVTGALSDSDSVILSGEGIFKGTRQYFKVDQFGGSWYEKTGGTGTVVTDNSGTADSEKADDSSGTDLKEELKASKTVISVSPDEKTLTVGGATALGETVSLITPTEGFYNLVNTIGKKLDHTDYAFVMTFLNKFAEFAQKNGAEQVALSFFVDSQNRIVAFSMGLDTASDDGDIALLAVKNGAENGNYEAEYYTGKAYIAAHVHVTETEFEPYEIPGKKDVLPISTETLKSKLTEYITGPLLENHPTLNKVYETIAGKVISGKVEDFLSALKNGGISAGISSIRDSAAGAGEEALKIAKNFLEAFGIKGDEG